MRINISSISVNRDRCLFMVLALFLFGCVEGERPSDIYLAGLRAGYTVDGQYPFSMELHADSTLTYYDYFITEGMDGSWSKSEGGVSTSLADGSKIWTNGIVSSDVDDLGNLVVNKTFGWQVSNLFVIDRLHPKTLVGDSWFGR